MMSFSTAKLERGATLVTSNTKEFARVQGLGLT
jgi:predicted nucleic acid-binding protein